MAKSRWSREIGSPHNVSQIQQRRQCIVTLVGVILCQKANALLISPSPPCRFVKYHRHEPLWGNHGPSNYDRRNTALLPTNMANKHGTILSSNPLETMIGRLNIPRLRVKPFIIRILRGICVGSLTMMLAAIMPMVAGASTNTAVSVSASSTTVIRCYSPWGQLGKLGYASLLGSMLGWERLTHNSSRDSKVGAGVRTMALVALGACVFTLCGTQGCAMASEQMKVALLANMQQQQQQYHSPSGVAARAIFVEEQVAVTDVSRMASTVATGVGFLGAGVISNHRLPDGTYDPECTMRGLQTAAAIWTCAIIGVLSACGLYMWSFFVSTATIVILRYGRLLDPNIPSSNAKTTTNNIPNHPPITTTTATPADDQINLSNPVTTLKLSDPSQPLPTTTTTSTTTSPSLVVKHKKDGKNTTNSSPKGVSSDKKIWYKQDQQQQQQQKASLEEPFVEDYLNPASSSSPTKMNDDARTGHQATGRLDSNYEKGDDGSKEDTSLFRDSAGSIRPSAAAKVMDPLLNKFLQRGGNLSATFSGTSTVSSGQLLSTNNRTLEESSETWP